MLEEVVTWLRPNEGTYLDATLGDGGHSLALLESHPKLKLIGTDRDPASLEVAKVRLEKYSNRCNLYNARFSELADLLDEMKVDSIRGVIADLGVSSRQIEIDQRGFSFQNDGPLDMRMGDVGDTAADIINAWPEKELADLFYNYGEERASRRIAKHICISRKKKKFMTTLELADCVKHALGTRGKINPATKVFQALRIYVNDELGEIESLLNSIPEKLSVGGRLVVLSYHSLEDRIVKQSFKSWSKGDFSRPIKKVQIPSREEIRNNKRARSAKLRVLERVA